MSLFRPANNGQGGGQGQGRGQARKWWTPGAPNDTPVSFRAGKMEMDGQRVTPVEAKGVLYITKEDANLPVLCWKNLSTGAVEEEIIVLPGNQKFHKCKSAPEGSRVYYLKMSDSRHFFWMQEPDDTRDDELAERLNQVMEDERLLTSSLSDFASVDDSQDMMNLLRSSGLPMMGQGMGNLPPELMGQLFGMSTPPQGQQQQQQQQSQQSQQSQQEAPSTSSATTTTTPAATQQQQTESQQAEQQPEEAEQQQQQQQQQQQEEGSQDQSSLAAQGLIQGLAAEMQQQGMAEGAALSDILAPENVEILLADDEVVARLLPFLPNAESATREDLLQNIRSPQYAQSLQSFASALQSGELDGVMSQFGVDAGVAASQGGRTLGLCHAILAEQGASSANDNANDGQGATAGETNGGNDDTKDDGDNNDAMDSNPDE